MMCKCADVQMEKGERSSKSYLLKDQVERQKLKIQQNRLLNSETAIALLSTTEKINNREKSKFRHPK